MESRKIFCDVETYSKDKRKPIRELYNSFSELEKIRWAEKIIYVQKEKISGSDIRLPILGFRTKKKGRAVWIIAGIHGEEPAGPNALAENINFLNKASKDIPIVLLPLCNPIGYIKNWRYPYSKIKNNKSVGDSEHLLLNLKTLKPRRKKATCKEADKITKFILEIFRKYPPILVLDFHEDKSKTPTYIYSHGSLDNWDPIAIKIVKMLKKRGFKIRDSGKTIFGQKIINGIVSNVKDGSIDELFASKKIFYKKIIRGPSAKSIIVIETNVGKTPLSKRIKMHSEIIKRIKEFFNMAKGIEKIKR